MGKLIAFAAIVGAIALMVSESRKQGARLATFEDYPLKPPDVTLH